MITLDTIRRHAMSLPEVEEKTHFGKPGFRVRDKLFASFHPDGDQASAILNLDQTDAAAAMELDPAGLEEVWRTHGVNRIFVGLRADLAEVSDERCQQLVEQAWRSQAPKRLLKNLENR